MVVCFREQVILSPGSCREGGRFYLVCREKDFVLVQEL